MGCANSQLPAPRETPGGSVLTREGTDKQRQRQRALTDLLRGNMSLECPSTAKIVRIFTSSTFTDTRHERNALMERVYPVLKEMCQQQGYEFQVVDMRWGVRDEATDDHMGPELCLREVDLCRKLSTGPCFVTFLSHKYGYRNIPREIEATEFEKLLAKVPTEEAVSLLKRWFEKDENKVPPIYVLQPISSMLPDFRANDQSRKNSAKSEWSHQNTVMQSALADAAEHTLDADRAQRYAESVTESEICRAMNSNMEASSQCIWFDRKIQDIDSQETSYLLSRYKECLGPEERDRESRQRLAQLRERTLAQHLPEQNILSYNITWHPNGIDPGAVREHGEYIDRLCEDFRYKVSTMISQAIQTRQDTYRSSPVFDEVVQHTVFCQEKCRAFQGRTHTLQEIRSYLVGSSRQPFILHGTSGSGKTSIMATAATSAWDTLKSKAAIITRFIGTTPDSSNIGSLLISIITQLGEVYTVDTSNLPPTIKELREFFKSTLSRATTETPLVLFLDSLDQLDTSGDARQLLWIPRELPVNVKVVLSTLPEEKYEILPRLKALFPGTCNYAEVPTLALTEVTSIVDTWLEQAGRRLTTGQRHTVEEAFNRCPLPLFLKLSFDQTLKWRSYSPSDTTVLQDTVRGCIDTLFQRIEEMHGKILVERALAYLTLSRSGLSETELEDILSCDDDVLSDVYMYWTPPIRRLPPLLLVRVKAELGPYLVDRGADGVRVFYWYHRQFIEAATDRYCWDSEAVAHMHRSLGEFFSGVWSNGKTKPYIDSRGQSGNADRHVTSQPVKYGTNFNRRKLNNLPYHRQRAGQSELLMDECLGNLEFVSAKLKSEGLRQVTDDYLDATSHFPDIQPLMTLSEAIHLSQGALVTSPDELPAQLISRIKDRKGLEDFVAQCHASPTPFLLPSQRIVTLTGGALLHSPAEHTQEITGLDLTSDGKLAVTCGMDNSVKTWDVGTGKLLRSIDDTGPQSNRVYTACADTLVIVVTSNNIRAFDLHSGVEAYTLSNYMANSGFCLAGKDKTAMFVFLEKNVQIYSAADGAFLGTASNAQVQEDESMGCSSAVAGCEDFVAISEGNHGNKMYIFNVNDSAFLSTVIALPVSDANMKDIISCAAFSADRKHVIIGAGQSLHHMFFDIHTGDLVRTLPGQKHDRMSAFLHATPDGNYLISSNWNNVVIWDLQKSERHIVLQHIHRSIVNALTVDMRIFVTATNDLMLRIWDLTRDDSQGLGALLAEQQPLKTDVTSGAPSSEYFVLKSMYAMDSPRFLLLHGSFQHKGVAKEYVRVYDVTTATVLRQVKLQKSDQLIVPYGDHSMLVGSWDRTANILDLVTLTFIKQLQGYLPKMATSPNDIRVIACDKVVTPTKARRNIKVYSLATGRVTSVMKAGQSERISGLQLSTDEVTLLASTTKGPLLVFNTNTCCFLCSVNTTSVSLKNVVDVRMTSDNFLLFKSDVGDKHSIVVWDLAKKTEHCRLRTQPGHGAVRRFDVVADDTAVVVTDAHLHVFSISTGEQLDCVHSRHGTSRICCRYGSPYFTTFNNDIDDNAVKLWQTSPVKCVASFTPDIRPREIFLSRDGRTLLGYFNTTPYPVLWTLRGRDISPGGEAGDTGQLPNPYGNEYLEADLSSPREQLPEDPEDPDSDEDVAT
ncbi:NACHT and WD repeat domain-containing protein 2-like [Haliotis cracherodii]|uniref:NACHT and WD repeat domain-containing protein 2-like n=1 Tax=Haliotis cracherodii TaxID=6455 RepID=UPI0039EC04EA